MNGRSLLKLPKFRTLNVPPTFKLKKYDACKRWRLDEWSNAISDRVFLLKDWIKSSRKEWDLEDVDKVYTNYKAHVDELISELTAEPRIFHIEHNRSLVLDHTIADFFEDAGNKQFFNSHWFETYSKWSRIDIFMFNLAGSTYKSDDFEDFESASKVIDLVEKTPSWVMRREVSGTARSVATAEVNLAASDADIVNDFRDWLKETRTKMGLQRISHDRGDNDFSKWHLDKALPCFDLILYAKIHNGKFSNSALAKALGESEERVRKTIVPNVFKIVSETTDAVLRNQLRTRDGSGNGD